MLTFLALLWTVLVAAQAPSSASATVVSAAELDATFKRAIANNTVDTMVKTTPILGGNATVAVLHRVRAETSALIHDHVTEVYQITEGSGTLVTGGTLQDPRESDLTRVGAGLSHSGTHVGGTPQRVGPKDVIIVPAGMPHRFSQLDGPISYLVYRFEPTGAKK